MKKNYKENYKKIIIKKNGFIRRFKNTTFKF